ncbi:hypothetical protein MMPV_000057 [Pyropia vietnamensis]
MPASATSPASLSPSTSSPSSSAKSAPPPNAWEVQYRALVEFRRTHGHSHTALGTDERLLRWTQLQRAMHRQGQLHPERIARLNAIGMVWNRHNSQWEARLYELRQFKAARGHVRVPTSGPLAPLGAWVQNQRTSQRMGRLAPDRLAKLDALGMEWGHHRLPTWESRFADLSAYASANGGVADVPLSVDVSLHNWVSSQRTQWRKGLMTPVRAARLKSIGFVWDAQQASWKSRLGEFVRLREEILRVTARIADGSMSVAELVSATEADDATDDAVGGAADLERAARELCLQRLAAAQTAKGRASAASWRSARKYVGGGTLYGAQPRSCDIRLQGGRGRTGASAGNGLADGGRGASRGAAGPASSNGVAVSDDSARGSSLPANSMTGGRPPHLSMQARSLTPPTPVKPGSSPPASTWSRTPEMGASVVPTKLPPRLRKLQLWMLTQRRLLRTGALRPERFAQLLDAQFEFDWFDLEWERGFARLQAAVALSGGRWHPRVCCPDEALLFWVRTQRSAKRAGAISPHRVQRLDELGVFDDTAL